VSSAGIMLYWYVSIDPKFIGGRLHPSATHDVTIQKTVLRIMTAISDVLFLKLQVTFHHRRIANNYC